MWLKITDINLDKSSISVDIAPGETDDFPGRLDKFVGRCIVEGIQNVQIFYRYGTSARDIQRLEDFVSLKRLPQPAPASAAPARAADADYQRNNKGLRFSCHPADSLEGQTPRNRSECERLAFYRITVHGLDLAVESINKAIAIVGTSLNLDSRSSLHLRLCIYELTMNTAEHGDFSDTAASIELTLEFTDNTVWVVYRDDSRPFATISTAGSGIVGQNMTTRSKRGLGLYMINRLCPDFNYERSDNWNTSTFSLEIKSNKLTAKKG
jgi:anti-sigma regulatory factor (Ser/Thr protein kinase)